jgi:hypothetical protein
VLLLPLLLLPPPLLLLLLSKTADAARHFMLTGATWSSVSYPATEATGHHARWC